MSYSMCRSDVQGHTCGGAWAIMETAQAFRMSPLDSGRESREEIRDHVLVASRSISRKTLHNWRRTDVPERRAESVLRHDLEAGSEDQENNDNKRLRKA